MEGEWRSDDLSAMLLAFGKGRAVKCMNLSHLDDIGISSFLEIQQKKKKKAKSMIVWEDGSHLACWSIQTYQHFVPKGLTAPTSRFWVCFYSSGFYYNHNIWPNTYSVLFIFKLVMQIQGRTKRSCEALFLLPAGHSHPVRCWQWWEPASGATESGISTNMLVQSRDQTAFVHETRADCDQQNDRRSSFSQFQFNLV